METWLRDTETGQKFKILSVSEWTADIVDDFGHRRGVNRAILESDLKSGRVVSNGSIKESA